ncbi:MAG: L-seryl-tRNA(Sec) selenium transferase [Candidatus Obscuribacterales bacterium]|nr:L-seryl-tRNA(Sec) selenium transferase [Candidatus Obscuribacterales bacterium]
MTEQKSVSLRMPQVDRVLREPLLEELSSRVRRDVLTVLVREDMAQQRRLFEGNGGKEEDAEAIEPSAIAERVVKAAELLFLGGVRRVINGTGVILNTNLGRAPLPISTLNRLSELGQGYTSLEIDVATGKRGERTAMISRLLSLLTGCQSAIVVNNNASAVMLAVSALARGKEVIVSRGELIEIGGSFRLPDVITASGGILKEVGTTNRTRVGDYRAAITTNTGCILRCHRSNFEITGFTEEPKLSELVQLSKESGIPLVEDLGSGALFDISKLGLRYEPTVDRVIESGVGLVLFSGDKLLGGPQAGIIAGDNALVTRLRKDPIYRALRVDKLIVALIEIVLAQYLTTEPSQNLPVIALAAQSLESIDKRVHEFISMLRAELSADIVLSVVDCLSALGGGSLPGQTLPSRGLQVGSSTLPITLIAQRLRNSDPSILSIIQNDSVLIDFRTILQRDELELKEALLKLSSV